MRNWTELADVFAGRDVMVIGNGPSRVGHEDVIGRSSMPLIGCNAVWREFVPTYLVCYEAKQAELALKHVARNDIIVPQQGLDPVCTVLTSEKDDDRVFEAAPHRGAGDWERVIDQAWWPTSLGVGNLAGLLAYQLAMVGRARSVYLFGVDCCGLTLAGSDQVALSAIDGAPGYGPARAPARAMVGGPRTPAPEGWDQYRSLWRALTRRAEDAGIKTFRALDAGALDWLEVREPCPD
jgi:hypothetical protein